MSIKIHNNILYQVRLCNQRNIKDNVLDQLHQPDLIISKKFLLSLFSFDIFLNNTQHSLLSKPVIIINIGGQTTAEYIIPTVLLQRDCNNSCVVVKSAQYSTVWLHRHLIFVCVSVISLAQGKHCSKCISKEKCYVGKRCPVQRI